MSRFSLKNTARLVSLAVLALCSSAAFAHHEAGPLTSGFEIGFGHPFSGMDHLLAMLAVGLWAAQNKRPALWVLPIAFPLMMAAGAAMGMAGMRLSGMEMGIAGSVAVLGLLIVFAVRMPVWVSASMVSLFAVTHGYAHGLELPSGASALQYGAGFIAATALLHVLGVAAGWFAGDKSARKLVRVAGAGIAATGAYLLMA